MRKQQSSSAFTSLTATASKAEQRGVSSKMLHGLKSAPSCSDLDFFALQKRELELRGEFYDFFAFFKLEKSAQKPDPQDSDAVSRI
jgi:hypothetical protein